MAISIRNLRLELGESPDVLLERAARRMKIPLDRIASYGLIRRSLDARDHDSVCYSCNVRVALRDQTDEARLVARLHRGDVELARTSKTTPIRPGKVPFPGRPVVVGFGPAGMFAALLLAENGYAPLVLERGRDVRRRHADILDRFYRQGEFDPESNLLYGEGGAGAYSDGKLYTRVSDARVESVMHALYRFGMNPDLIVHGRPHVGSDKLPGICRRMRKHIEALGGEVRFESLVDGLELRGGRIEALQVSGERIEASVCLLGTGHSARDTYQLLSENGVKLVAKPYQIGLRIEHPQDMVNRWQYGKGASCGQLPPAEYNVVARKATEDGRDLFSFCMCPGGTVLLTNEAPGLIATNGASRSGRNEPLANSGLVVTRLPDSPDQDPLEVIALQRHWEEAAYELTGRSYALPCQRASDLLAERPSDGELRTSSPTGGVWADVRSIVPPSVLEGIVRGLGLLDERMPGYAGSEAVLTGPETRGSAPVRVLRDTLTRESVSVTGLYPIGEGAGYAGGIVSSAVDGLKSAETIISRYQPVL